MRFSTPSLTKCNNRSIVTLEDVAHGGTGRFFVDEGLVGLGGVHSVKGEAVGVVDHAVVDTVVGGGIEVF